MAELSTELPATGGQAALRPIYVAGESFSRSRPLAVLTCADSDPSHPGFLCAFGLLLSLLTQRTLAATRRPSISSVHLFTLILLGVS